VSVGLRRFRVVLATVVVWVAAERLGPRASRFAEAGPEPTHPLARELFIADDSGVVHFGAGQPELPVGTAVYLYQTSEHSLECKDGRKLRVWQEGRPVAATIHDHGAAGHPADGRDAYRHGRLQLETDPLSRQPLSGGPCVLARFDALTRRPLPYSLVLTKAPQPGSALLHEDDAHPFEMSAGLRSRLVAALTRLSDAQIKKGMTASAEGGESLDPGALLDARLRAARLLEEFGFRRFQSESQSVIVAALKRYQLPEPPKGESLPYGLSGYPLRLTVRSGGRTVEVASEPLFSHVIGVFTADAATDAVRDTALLDSIDQYMSDGAGFLNDYPATELIDHSIAGVFDALGDGSLQLIVAKSGAESLDVHVLVFKDGRLRDAGVHYSGGL
jgi:hypothetical protein